MFVALVVPLCVERDTKLARYDEFMTDSSVDKAQKTKDIEHKSSKKQNQEQSLQDPWIVHR